MQIVPLSASSLLVRAYNPLLVLMLVSFFALSLRYFILLFSECSRAVTVNAFRLLAGALFLVLGWLYALLVMPQIVWDRPARIAAALPAAGLLLWVWRRRKTKRGVQSHFLSFLVGCTYGVLLAVLLLAATLSVLRSGYLALIGDRVTLLVDVTGETQNESRFVMPGKRNTNPCQGLLAGRPVHPLLVLLPSDFKPKDTLTLHHVIISLPTGERASDFWISGDDFAVIGQAVRLSPSLHSHQVPNLYALRYVCNGSLKPEPPDTFVPEVIEFPNSGSLRVAPWWRPAQQRLWNFWARRVPGDSALAIQIATDASPYYPLVDADGKPLHKLSLLVLRPSAVATSRGSSPLEGKLTPFK